MIDETMLKKNATILDSKPELEKSDGEDSEEMKSIKAFHAPMKAWVAKCFEEDPELEEKCKIWAKGFLAENPSPEK